MSDDGRTERRRFTRRDRRIPAPAERVADVDRAKFADSLDAIETFLMHATAGGRGAFARNSPAYASGSMAIIRTAALFEVDGFRPYLVGVPEETARGIMTTRNTASHDGYRAMDDDILWETLMAHLPPLLTAWREALRREDRTGASD